MSLKIRAAGASDPGRVRENNEDAFFVGQQIFCVADGLGGHQAGEVASSLATSTLDELDTQPIEVVVPALADTVREANRLVFEAARSDVSKAGMGTTMTTVAIDGAAAHLAHVGDSRAYLVRGDDVQQLTDDHTVVGRMVAEGLMTLEAAATHPQRSILTRALGTERSVEVDVIHAPLRSDDRILLCSDGLTAVIADGELPGLVGVRAGGDLDAICANLIEIANQRGGPDNITVIVVAFDGTPSGGVPASPASSIRRGESRSRRGPSRRLLAWVIVLAVLIGGSIAGSRAWVAGNYVVAIQGDEVVIYNGFPVVIPPFTFQRDVQPTGLRSEDIQAFARKALEEGEQFRSLKDAEAFVERKRLEISTPSPSPSPTPRGSRSP